jgi:hypothetical protein
MSKSEATCLICNETWSVHEGRENKQIFCRMCRSHESAIDYGHDDPCLPWRGNFDADDNPIKGTTLYLPGNRICGHRDCVQDSHIASVQPWQALEAERNDRSYVNGRKSHWTQLTAQLKKEIPEMSDPTGKITKTS